MHVVRRHVIALAMLAAAAPAAAGDAAAGLQAMRELNLIVLGDWQAGQDVEGKTFIGGNASGNSSSLGIGNAAQGAAASTRRTLTVAGNNSISSINLNNGSNGGNGLVASSPGVAIVGNSTGINLNAAGAGLDVGGNLTGNYNVGNGQSFTIGGNLTGGGINGQAGATVRVGGTIQGNVNANGATILQNQGLGFNAALLAPVTAEKASLTADLAALSSALAGLVITGNPSSISYQGGRATFNAVDGGAGFAVFNVDRNIFSYSEFDYNFGTSAPVIINVFDPTTTLFTYGANPVGGNNGSRNGQVIWNFVNATRVDFTRMVHGSVLAVNALITNNTPIEGSVAVGRFNQGGEVHLGTYAGGDGFLGSTVPEPATWLQFLAGFGLVGAVTRRRQRLARAA